MVVELVETTIFLFYTQQIYVCHPDKAQLFGYKACNCSLRPAQGTTFLVVNIICIRPAPIRFSNYIDTLYTINPPKSSFFAKILDKKRMRLL